MNTSDSYQFDEYWRVKDLLPKCPSMPIRRWWETTDLSEIEQIYLDTICDAQSLLDFGAGNLRIKNKFVTAGFGGVYHTVDIGGEFDHTYRTLDEIDRTYDAILCLDVIEHLPMATGVAMLRRLIQLLNPGGVLILGTPNARSIRNPMAMDFTHVHCYSPPDLWALMTVLGLEVEGFRLVFSLPPRSIADRVRFLVQAFVIAKIIGADYADGIALIGRKPQS